MAPKKVIRQSPFLFVRRAFCWSVAFLLLAAVPARAALQFDAFLGYDDYLPERSWFPISCELYNDGPPFNAVIEVSAEDFGRGQTRRFALDLPTNTRKRIFIPVFASARSWNVRLVDESGKVRAETLLDQGKSLGNGLPLVAGLARTTSGLPTFPEMTQYAGWQYGAARLQPALFPDNPLTLEGIDLLYLSSEKAANLTIGQVSALLAWLQAGGHLVLGVEDITDVNGTPWLRQLLPCELTSSANLKSHDSLQEWTRQHIPNPEPGEAGFSRRHYLSATGTRPAGPSDNAEEDAEFAAEPLLIATGTLRHGTILIGDVAAPLAIEAPCVRGLITVLTFSPEREPFLSWKNRPWFWARMAGIPTAMFQQSNPNIQPSRLSSDGIFGAMIDSKQVRKLPLGWLLVLLVAYLLVIGPFDQFWLKKINRQMLTWITFPCYVVIFSGLIYFIGFHLRAGELEWNELSLVDILPDNDQSVLRGQTYVSIYSPNNAHYQLAAPEKFASLRGEYLGNFGGNQETSRSDIDQTGNSFDADVLVPVWTSQLFVNDWVGPSATPLTMTASRTGSGWSVTVQNNFDRALPQARAILGGKTYQLGELPPGQSKTFSLDETNGTIVGEMARQFEGPFKSAVQSRHNSFGNNNQPLPDIADAAMAASFISFFSDDNSQGWNNFTTPAGLDLSRFALPEQGILLAWDADHAPAPGLNQFQPRRLHRNTLWRLVAPVKL
jgi:hypothetical protein